MIFPMSLRRLLYIGALKGEINLLQDSNGIGIFMVVNLLWF